MCCKSASKSLVVKIPESSPEVRPFMVLVATVTSTLLTKNGIATPLLLSFIASSTSCTFKTSKVKLNKLFKITYIQSLTLFVFPTYPGWDKCCARFISNCQKMMKIKVCPRIDSIHSRDVRVWSVSISLQRLQHRSDI